MKNLNFGFSCLRIWMAYSVVAVHFFKARQVFPDGFPAAWKWFFDSRAFAVPIFMTMSFFLSVEKFTGEGDRQVRSRLMRLGVPFVVWSVLCFLLDAVLSWADAGWPYRATLGDLGWQLVGGTSEAIAEHLWFMADLFWLTVFTFAIGRLLRGGRGLAVLAAFFVGAVMMEYSGLNRWLFWRFPYEIRFFLGRFVEMTPYVTVGLALARCRKAFDGASLGVRWLAVASGLFVFVYMCYFEVCPIVDGLGFYYEGLQWLLRAVPLLLAAYFLPTERIPSVVTRTVGYLSGLTMGVYFSHYAIGRVLHSYVFQKFGILTAPDLWQTLVVYVASFAFCLLVSLVPVKFVRNLVR